VQLSDKIILQRRCHEKINFDNFLRRD